MCNFFPVTYFQRASHPSADMAVEEAEKTEKGEVEAMNKKQQKSRSLLFFSLDRGQKRKKEEKPQRWMDGWKGEISYPFMALCVG